MIFDKSLIFKCLFYFQDAARGSRGGSTSGGRRGRVGGRGGAQEGRSQWAVKQQFWCWLHAYPVTRVHFMRPF